MPAVRKKTGGRVKGSPNKRTGALREKLTEAVRLATADLTSEQVEQMTALDVMVRAMRIEVLAERWPSAAAIAEKVAPYFHAKVAPKQEGGGEPATLNVVISGGLPDPK